MNKPVQEKFQFNLSLTREAINWLKSIANSEFRSVSEMIEFHAKIQNRPFVLKDFLTDNIIINILLNNKNTNIQDQVLKIDLNTNSLDPEIIKQTSPPGSDPSLSPDFQLVNSPDRAFSSKRTTKLKGCSTEHDGYSEAFLACWEAYPRRPNDSKRDACKKWSARKHEGATEAEMLDGAKRYAAYILATGTEPQYIKQAQTFFGPARHYLLPWTAPSTTAKEKPLDRPYRGDVL